MKTLFAILIILLGCPTITVAKTMTLPSEHSSISIPESWTQEETPGALFAAKDVENGFSIGIHVSSNPHNSRYDKGRIDNIKKGISTTLDANGAKVDFGDENPIVIGGVPSFFFNFTVEASSSPIIYGRFYGIAANGKLYSIILESLSPDKTTELDTIASSFQFDSPPELPDDSYEAGYKVGEYLTPILMLVATLFIARKLLYSKSAKR